MTTDTGVLGITPKDPASRKPTIDPLTRKLTATFRLATVSGSKTELHTCTCGAKGNKDIYTLPGGIVTSSLCVHYIAYHREEMPIDQQARILALNSGDAVPNDEELVHSIRQL